MKQIGIEMEINWKSVSCQCVVVLSPVARRASCAVRESRRWRTPHVPRAQHRRLVDARGNTPVRFGPRAPRCCASTSASASASGIWREVDVDDSAAAPRIAEQRHANAH
jgi:hypothetical protein